MEAPGVGAGPSDGPLRFLSCRLWIFHVLNQGAAAGTGQGQHLAPSSTLHPNSNSSAPRPPPVILSSSPFFLLTSLSSSSAPSLLSQTGAPLPLFHLPLRTPLPRSSPRPVFIRGALTAHSTVGLIHHHQEERVRGVGTKSGGGGKAERHNGKTVAV